MTYHEFLTQIKEQILNHIEEPESYDITIRKVRKNNDVVLDGLSIIGRDHKVFVSVSIIIFKRSNFYSNNFIC